MEPILFPNDTSFWYETLRVLGHTAYGGADIGEVVTTAQRITAGDYDSWHDEWLATADRVATEADKMLAAGHGSAPATASCGPTTTTGRPSSFCTATPTIRASTTPTRGHASVS